MGTAVWIKQLFDPVEDEMGNNARITSLETRVSDIDRDVHDIKKDLRGMVGAAVGASAEPQKQLATVITIVSCSVGIVLAVWGVVSYYMRAEISKRIDGPLASIQEHINGIDQRLNGIDRRLDKAEAKSAANSLLAPPPSGTQLQKQYFANAKETIEELASRHLAIQAITLTQFGDRALAAASTVPAAWQASLSAIDYKSELNANTFANEQWKEDLTPLPPWLKQYEKTYRPSGSSEPRVYYRGTAPIPESFIILPLGQTDPRIGKMSKADKEARFDGGEYRLDLLYLRNIWFYNATIHYAGKPFVAKNVVFINCTFIMENVAPAHDLAKAILLSDVVSIQTS